jgi:hypothetical protein
MKTTIRLLTTLLLFLSVSLAAPNARAVIPPPDGGYPNFTTAEGTKALFSLTTGSANTAVGWFSLFSNAEGSFNTATGAGALLFNTADGNAAFGAAALLFNTTGINNTAVGAAALSHNTIAEENTATGAFALSSNTEGDFNTANGAFTLFTNNTGERNTATGDSALYGNTTGGNNTANGFQALKNNTTGFQNTANGLQALLNNTTGDDNTATGVVALLSNTTGDGNTANGVGALFSNTTGTGNIALGFSAGFNLTTGNNNIDIGNNGVAAEASTIRIGSSQTRAFIAGIRGVATGVGDAIPVLIDSDGQLGTMSSSKRFKNEIKPMDKASEAILAFQPVTFHYKSDKRDTPQFGLIAEEVAEVNPDLIVRDKDGEIYTVRYDAVNAMLLNEFLKEHRKVEKLEATVADLAAQLQKISAQVEMNSSVAKVAGK